jgi:4-amino-4-deoxy-L-arabinose transferase-like glycosyltransferase
MLMRRIPQSPTNPSHSPLREALRSLFWLTLLVAAAGTAAFQLPATLQLAVGWPGDRLFLTTSAGLSEAATLRGDLFADELVPDAPLQRARWTRAHARLHVPAVGRAAALQLQLTLQGWPDQADQPSLSVQANGVPLGTVRLSPAWQTLTFDLPPSLLTADDLTIDLYIDATLQSVADPREKGARLAAVTLLPAAQQPAVLPPAAAPLGWLWLTAVLLWWSIRQLRPTTATPMLTAITATALLSLGLALLRPWTAALLPGLAAAAAVAALLTLLPPLWRLLRQRLSALSTTSVAVVATPLLLAAPLLLTAALAAAWLALPFWTLGVPLGAALALFSLLLPDWAQRAAAALQQRPLALSLLLLFAGAWLSFGAWAIFQLPYVGHADYSDNALVARNLVAGRGWVVDHVSQFYEVWPSLLRPQETWPLLQPLWIAPFFALFGPTEWAARLPNLLFNGLLLLTVYQIGTRGWDRRVGLTAAVLLLTNYLFFRLTIYAANDLAFVVFSTTAIAALIAADHHGPHAERWRMLSAAATGLMMLQKPSGAMIALGLGLWQVIALLQQEGFQLRALLRGTLPIARWSLLALLILSPYLLRNLIVFGAPVHSTESYDAWLLDYRGVSGEAWSEIYRVYAPEWGGPGLPDRSWILRWGFDATWQKFVTQVVELRAYLMPAWPGLPAPLSWPFSHEPVKNIAMPLGNWLALAGLLAAARNRRRELTLVLAAFLPYVIFMLIYWRTNEERYWVLVLPWLLLAAAALLWQLFDRLSTRLPRLSGPLLLTVLLAVALIVSGSRADIRDKLENEPRIWAQDLAAYAWLDDNLPADAAVMTRLPWQLNWHTERPALMIPNTADRELLLQIAEHYQVEYLVLENQLRVKGDAGRLLAPLMDQRNQVGDLIDGFELIYASPTDDFRAFVYRLPQR